MSSKPLGGKAYGSIGHLPGSRTGPRDKTVPQGQADICTVKTRDRHDLVIVQEKLDGSCTAVARVDGQIVALTRKGYLASSSPYEQHRMFADWAAERVNLFSGLADGDRIVGEWLAQAHGTLYDDLNDATVWAPFDWFVSGVRLNYNMFAECLSDYFRLPHLVHFGDAVSVECCMHCLSSRDCEGLVYRVERRGKVDFLAKWVRPDKIDGQCLPEISGKPAVWNWRPEKDGE